MLLKEAPTLFPQHLKNSLLNLGLIDKETRTLSTLVLSHTGPLKYEPTEVFLPMIDQSTVDKSTEVWLEQIEAKLDYERWYFAHYHTEKEVGKIRIMHNDYTMIPHEASVAAEKDMIRRMHRQAEIAEALGLLDDAPNQKNGDDIS